MPRFGGAFSFVTDCEQAIPSRYYALPAVYSSHINRNRPVRTTFTLIKGHEQIEIIVDKSQGANGITRVIHSNDLNVDGTRWYVYDKAKAGLEFGRKKYRMALAEGYVLA